MNPAAERAPTRGSARLTRGLTAGVVCTLLSFTGHAGAGGACPDLGLLLVLGLLLTGFLVVLADRRRGPLAVLGAVGTSQLTLHGLLQLLSGSAPAAEHVHAAGGDPLLMLGAHALATVVTAAMLAGAEAGVFAVVSALSWAMTRVVRLVSVAVAPPRAARRLLVLPPPRDARPRGMLGRHVCPRRGPPTRLTTVSV